MLLKEEGTKVYDNPLIAGATNTGIWFNIINTKYPFFIDLIDTYIALSSKEEIGRHGCEELAAFSLKNEEFTYLKEILLRRRKCEEVSLEKQFIELVSHMKEDPANS